MDDRWDRAPRFEPRAFKEKPDIMRRSPQLSLVVLAIGVALVLSGIGASDSLPSAASGAVQHAPSNKAILLLALGAFVSVVGVVALVRRR
jgi:hypothetical protein